MGEILESWRALIETAQAKDWKPPILHEAGDLDHLRSIKAHPDLIAAAEHCYGFDDFYLAPTETKREYSTEFLFKNSLVIGDTGDGNFFLMVDARKPNSRIVYTDHDLNTVTVVAENIVEFFKALARGFDTPDFVEMKESCVGGFFDEFEAFMAQKTDSDLGLEHSKDESFDHFDFSKAKIGAEVDLTFRGKYTTIENGRKSGVLKLGTETKENIAKSKRRDWMLLFAIILAVVVMYFLLTKFGNASQKQALFFSPLFGAIGTFYCVHLYFDFQYKLEQRKEKRTD